MAGVDGPPPPRSGLYRSLPCQNISTADDSVWKSQAARDPSKTNVRRLTADVAGSSLRENRSKMSTTTTKMLRSPEKDYSSRSQTEEPLFSTGIVNMSSNIAGKPFSGHSRTPEENVTVVQPARGVVTSKSTPSFRDNGIDRVLKICEEGDFDHPTEPVNHEMANEVFSPVYFKTPSTPGTVLRSSIPVRSHRRSSSASSDDNSSSLNFMLRMVNGNGAVKQTPSSRQRSHSYLTPRQWNDSAGTNSAKQFSSLTSQHFHEGAASKFVSSGIKTPSNSEKKYHLNRAAGSQLVSIKSDSAQRSLLTATPKSTRPTDRGTSKIPSKTMSQPGSRSTSPSGKLAHLTYREPGALASVPSRPTSARTSTERTVTSQLRTPSRVPRSQGQSRDTSPCQSSDGSEKYGKALRPSKILTTNYSAIETPLKMSLLSGRVLQTGMEMEQTLTDALSDTLNLHREDGASETSSVSSDISQMQLNASQSPSEIIALMSSASYTDRRQGLIILQLLMKSNGVLNLMELKRVTEIFTRMFHDPKTKVFNIFLETLVNVLEVHAEDMDDWLYTCLSRLLIKLAGDLLGSVQGRIHKALHAVSCGFTFEAQMEAIAKFLTEQSLASNPRVRLALLDHIHGMTLMNESYAFVNSESCQQMALCVVQWTNEPKSSEIRRAAQSVVIALFNMNTPEFSAVLSKLPRSIQDCATRILHNHMHSISQNVEPQNDLRLTSTNDQSLQSCPTAKETNQMSSEDYFTSLKKAAEDIQNLSSLS